MAENSKIEWTDHTYNPWIGCTKVSPGCEHCYAESDSKRRGWAKWGKGMPRQKTNTYNDVSKWNEQALAEGKRKRVFCASLSDVFDPEVDPLWREELFGRVRVNQALQWLILTKRPQLIPKLLPTDWGDGWEHVSLMTSVEDQLRANIRIPRLIETPARFRSLSVEPLLGPITLKPEWLRQIHWIIVGGESGGKARPMHPGWVRSLRDQCLGAGVAFFFKQWGCFSPDSTHRKWNAGNSVYLNDAGETWTDAECSRAGQAMSDKRPTAIMYRTSKELAGRILDGLKHDDHPFDLDSVTNRLVPL